MFEIYTRRAKFMMSLNFRQPFYRTYKLYICVTCSSVCVQLHEDGIIHIWYLILSDIWLSVKSNPLILRDNSVVPLWAELDILSITALR